MSVNVKAFAYRRGCEKAIKATQGTRRMPWDMPAKKDGGGHERVRGAAKRALIRMCLNGETPQK